MIPNCMICRKALAWVDMGSTDYGEKADHVDAAGNVQIRFFYGSKHDQGIDWHGIDTPYKGYVCDECTDNLVKEGLIQVRGDYTI